MLKIKKFSKSDKIAITALVELELNKKDLCLLLLPKGGGQSFSFEGKNIKVVTPESPLGDALTGKAVDDSVVINQKEYFITKIY